jgi:hypothetical protein
MVSRKMKKVLFFFFFRRETRAGLNVVATLTGSDGRRATLAVDLVVVLSL